MAEAPDSLTLAGSAVKATFRFFSDKSPETVASGSTNWPEQPGSRPFTETPVELLPITVGDFLGLFAAATGDFVGLPTGVDVDKDGDLTGLPSGNGGGSDGGTLEGEIRLMKSP